MIGKHCRFLPCYAECVQVAVSLFLVFYRDGVQTKFPRSFGVFRVIIEENGVFRRDVEALAQCFINFPVRLYELYLIRNECAVRIRQEIKRVFHTVKAEFAEV